MLNGPSQNWHKTPEATPGILLELLDKDDATNRLLAKHPKASEELLEKLSHSSEKAVRRCCCSPESHLAPSLLVLTLCPLGTFSQNSAFIWLKDYHGNAVMMLAHELKGSDGL